MYVAALHLWVMNAVFKAAQGIVGYKGKCPVYPDGVVKGVGSGFLQEVAWAEF